MSKTTRMTTAQAIVKFLDNQYVSMDGVETMASPWAWARPWTPTPAA